MNWIDFTLLTAAVLLVGFVLGGLIESRTERGRAVEAGVAEYYLEGKKIEFRYLTNEN